MRKTFLIILGILLFILFSLGSSPTSSSTKQNKSIIRVTSWNVLNFSGESDDSRVDHISEVLKHIEPDILVLQEMESQSAVDYFYSKIMKTLIKKKKYGIAPFFDGPDTDNAMFFDKGKLGLVSHQQIPTANRDISEFKIQQPDSVENEVFEKNNRISTE